MSTSDLHGRARTFAALGDPARLAIVELLDTGDLSPKQLSESLGIPTNLLSHHLQVLADAGLISRRPSEGDRRRTYLRRTAQCDRLLASRPVPRPRAVAFVCSQNSARSQLAEAYWRSVSRVRVCSAGTHPAAAVHPLAIATGRRHGLTLDGARPKLIDTALSGDELVISVCDRAHEELATTGLHWSIADPAARNDLAAFETAFTELVVRIDRLAAAIEPVHEAEETR